MVCVGYGKQRFPAHDFLVSANLRRRRISRFCLEVCSCSASNSFELFRIVAFQGRSISDLTHFSVGISACNSPASAEEMACLCLTANVRVSRKHAVLMMV